MSRPVMPWESDPDDVRAPVVWHGRLDGRYQIEVTARDGGGVLRVYDHQRGDRLWRERHIVLPLLTPTVVEAFKDLALALVDGEQGDQRLCSLEALADRPAGP